MLENFLCDGIHYPKDPIDIIDSKNNYLAQWRHPLTFYEDYDGESLLNPPISSPHMRVFSTLFKLLI